MEVGCEILCVVWSRKTKIMSYPEWGRMNLYRFFLRRKKLAVHFLYFCFVLMGRPPRLRLLERSERPERGTGVFVFSQALMLL